MAEPNTVRDLLNRHHRRLYTFLRSLLPNASDAESALDETVRRLQNQAKTNDAAGFVSRAEFVARDVAAEWRAATADLPFSDALFRQLCDSAGPVLDKCEARYRSLGELHHQLPPPERELIRRRYELGLTTDQIAMSEGRPSAAVSRELSSLHESLVSARYAAVPDEGPPPPGGAADLGRLTSQLFDGTIGTDARLVLETLLLADPPAQAHYHRHAALVADLTWKYHPPAPIPEPPEPPAEPRAVTRREWWVTAAFVVACLAVASFVVLLFSGQLR